MANSYTKCYIQLVFVVKHRQVLIDRTWKDELEKYITGIIQNFNHKLLAIGAMPDHVHLFIGYNFNQTIPDLMERIKTSSNVWINTNKLPKYKFEWQRGYGAFTYSRSHTDRVIKYILNQEEHHRKKTFRSEYLEILRKHEVDYDERFLFDFFDDL